MAWSKWKRPSNSFITKACPLFSKPNQLKLVKSEWSIAMQSLSRPTDSYSEEKFTEIRMTFSSLLRKMAPHCCCTAYILLLENNLFFLNVIVFKSRLDWGHTNYVFLNLLKVEIVSLLPLCPSNLGPLWRHATQFQFLQNLPCLIFRIWRETENRTNCIISEATTDR